MANYSAGSGETIYGGRFGQSSIVWDDVTNPYPNPETAYVRHGTIAADPLYDPEQGVNTYLAAHGHRQDIPGDSDPARVWNWWHESGAWDGWPPGWGTFHGSRNYAHVWTDDAEQYGYDENWQVSGYQYDAVANYCGERHAAVLDSVKLREPTRYDWAGGISLYGDSMGGWGIWNQVFVMPSRWRSQIVCIDTQRTHTYTRALGTYSYSGEHAENPFIDRLGPTTDSAWDAFDFTLRMPVDEVAQNICYYVYGNVRRNSGLFDPIIMPYFVTHKVQIMASWSGTTHDVDDPASPLYDRDFSVPDLRKPFPVFTKSSGDWPYQWDGWSGVTVDNINVRGHVNLGLSWDNDGVIEDASQVVIPLRYRQKTGFPESTDTPPDMPPQVTVDVTIRRATLLPDTAYGWAYGAQSGTTGTDFQGLLTVSLTLDSSDVYTNLVVTK